MPADLSARGFARFYAPLAATSLLLTATNPLLTGALARTGDPTAALAGYAVAFALTGVLYSPLLVTQQVAAAWILEGGPIRPLRRFAVALGLVLSGLCAAVAFTDIGGWVLGDVVGLGGGVLAEALDAMALLWPVPLLTGLRALHQGRLVAVHRTHPIAWATGLRTAVLAGVAFALTAFGAGAWLGGAAFTAGLIAETVLVTLTPDPEGAEVSFHDPDAPGADHVFRFSTPLIANVMLWWATPLLIQSILARTPEPDCALAAFAVVEAIAWFAAAPVGQFQHASIALVDGVEAHRRVRMLTGVVALGVFALMAVVGAPGLREWILWTGFRLDPSLLAPAGRALPFAALYPLLYGHRQYFQGLFVRVSKPGPVGWGAALRVACIAAAAPFLFEPLGDNGAALGVGLAVWGLCVEGAFLWLKARGSVLPILAAGAAESAAPA